MTVTIQRSQWYKVRVDILYRFYTSHMDEINAVKSKWFVTSNIHMNDWLTQSYHNANIILWMSSSGLNVIWTFFHHHGRYSKLRWAYLTGNFCRMECTIGMYWIPKIPEVRGTCGGGGQRPHCTAGSGNARGRNSQSLRCGGGKGLHTGQLLLGGVTSQWRRWLGSCCSRTKAESFVRTSETILEQRLLW